MIKALERIGILLVPSTLFSLFFQSFGLEEKTIAVFSIIVLIFSACFIWRDKINLWVKAHHVILGGLVVVGMAVFFVPKMIGKKAVEGAPKAGSLIADLGAVREAQDIISANSKYGVAASIRLAREEIVFYGLSFHITMDTYASLICDALKRGVRIRVMMPDPDKVFFKHAANFAGDKPESGRLIIANTIQRVESINQCALKSQSNRKIETLLIDEIPGVRLYIFDGNSPNIFGYVIPYISGVNSTTLPAFIIKKDIYGVMKRYHEEFDRKWNLQSTAQ